MTVRRRDRLRGMVFVAVLSFVVIECAIGIFTGIGYAAEGERPYAKGSVPFEPMVMTMVDQLWDHCRAGDLGSAEQVFARIIEADPDNDVAYVCMAWGFSHFGDKSRVEGLLHTALEMNPQNGWAMQELGWYYLSEGSLKESRAWFRAALAVEPTNGSVSLGLGYCCAEAGRDREAENMFKRTLQIDPGNDDALFALARLYGSIRCFDRGVGFFTKRLHEDPANVKRYGAAMRILMAYEGVVPHGVRVRWYRGAIAFFLRVIEIDPAWPPSYYEVGRLYLRCKDARSARPYLERALQFDPDDHDALIEHAHALVMSGAIEEACSLLRGIDHGGTWYATRMALWCLEEKAYDKAKEYSLLV